MVSIITVILYKNIYLNIIANWQCCSSKSFKNYISSYNLHTDAFAAEHLQEVSVFYQYAPIFHSDRWMLGWYVLEEHGGLVLLHWYPLLWHQLFDWYVVHGYELFDWYTLQSRITYYSPIFGRFGLIGNVKSLISHLKHLLSYSKNTQTTHNVMVSLYDIQIFILNKINCTWRNYTCKPNNI